MWKTMFKPEILPIVASCVAGMSLSFTYGMRCLTQHNDIVIDKRNPYKFATDLGAKKIGTPDKRYTHSGLGGYGDN